MLSTNGSFILDRVTYMVHGARAHEPVLIITADNKITVTDLDGEILIEHTRPGPGIKYVGNGRPPGGPHRTPEPSPKS